MTHILKGNYLFGSGAQGYNKYYFKTQMKDRDEIIGFLQKPIGNLFNGQELIVPKSINAITKWLDKEQVTYEKFETGEFHSDGKTPVVSIKLKDVPDSHQVWAITHVLSAITMKYYILHKVINNLENKEE